MEFQVDCDVPSTNSSCPKRCCCVPSDDIAPTGCVNTNNSDYVFDMNDHTTLISNCLRKNIKHHCQDSSSELNKSKPNTHSSKPWITFMQILFSVRKSFIKMILVRIFNCLKIKSK